MFQFSIKVTDISVKTYRNDKKRKPSQVIETKAGWLWLRTLSRGIKINILVKTWRVVAFGPRNPGIPRTGGTFFFQRKSRCFFSHVFFFYLRVKCCQVSVKKEKNRKTGSRGFSLCIIVSHNVLVMYNTFRFIYLYSGMFEYTYDMNRRHEPERPRKTVDDV